MRLGVTSAWLAQVGSMSVFQHSCSRGFAAALRWMAFASQIARWVTNYYCGGSFLVEVNGLGNEIDKNRSRSGFMLLLRDVSFLDLNLSVEVALA